MSEVLPLAHYRQRVRPRPTDPASETNQIFFDRSELDQILSLYARRVIAGEWCDYAIEIEYDSAAFAVYRRAREAPIFRIVKRARAPRLSFGYLVTAGGRVLRYGRSLKTVLEVFERRRPRLIG